MRVSENNIAITPSATDKGRMRWEEVGLMTMNGESLTPALKPSIEAEMHLSIYQRRDVKAIVHAHPVFATAFTAMKSRINTCLTAESCAILDEPVFVPYALMGTKKLAGIVAKGVEKSKIILLENHGIITLGDNLLQAFNMIEVLENAARMTVIVEIMGNKKPLSGLRMSEIKKMFR